MTDETVTHPMRPAARRVLAASGCVLSMIPPVGAYYLLRSRRARVEVSAAGLAERSLVGTHAVLRPGAVTRLGVYLAPVAHGGVAGAGVRAKVGGDTGVNLCWRDASGRTRFILVSMYEDADGIIDAARRLTGLPLEALEMGFWGLRWPGPG